MKLTEFKSAVIARRSSDEILIALMDGEEMPGATRRCVGLLLCREDAARSMCAGVGSVLKDVEHQ